MTGRGQARGPVGWIRAIMHGAEMIAITLLATAMVGLALIQIILRNVFKTGWPWAEPLLGMGLLWLTMLGALAACGGGRKHISVDALSHLLPGRARDVVERVSALFAAGVCIALAIAAWRFVDMQREWSRDMLLGVPEWRFLMILPAAFALMAVRYLARTIFPARWTGPLSTTSREAA